MTQVRNRDAILRAGLVENIDFTAIDSEAVAAPLHALAELLRGGSGKGWTTVTALSTLAYPYFEHRVWSKFGDQIRKGSFDIVHRLTPLSPTTPSLLARRCAKAGVPFVLGPLNGGVPWPREFEIARRKEKEWLSYVRGVHKFLPGYRSTRQAASAIIIGSRDTWDQMPSRYRHKCIYIPENAIDPGRFTSQPRRPVSNPMRVVFVGRLVPYKGADMLIEAAAPLVRAGKLRLEIIGDGPQMNELKQLVAGEGVSSGVTLAGWVEHGRLQERYADADLLALPSIREFGGGVAIEAMAAGVVPIVVDYGGPAELVTEQTGFLMPMGPRSQIVGNLRELFGNLVRRPELVADRSPVAIRRVNEHFTWSAKAKQVLGVYRWVLDSGAQKPDFGMPLPDSLERLPGSLSNYQC